MHQAPYSCHAGRLTRARRAAPLALLLILAWPGSAAAEGPKAGGPEGAKWNSLFDGKTLGKWQVLQKFDFKRHGKVHVKDGCLLLEEGQPGTGARWTGPFPRVDYEVALEARRVEGGDFFCGMTFPVGNGALTLILGGWGGWVVGLSCINGDYAIDNETCQVIEFKQGRWYPVRVRVTRPKVDVWVDGKQIIELETKDRKLTVSWEMEPCQPFGFATWYTIGALRKIRYRSLAKPKAAEGRKKRDADPPSPG